MSHVIAHTVGNILPTVRSPPEKVIRYAQSLYNQSKANIPLKANEEPAREGICVVLAVERLRDQLKLPQPSTKMIPVPTKECNKLLGIFRAALQRPSAPNTPSKRKSAPSTPTKSRIQSPAASRVNTPSDAQRIFDTNVSQFNTPTRKTPLLGKDRFAVPQSPSKGSPSKRKKNGNTDPTIEDIYEKCDALQLEDQATEAVAYGYRHYNKQIKEKWLFLGGLICCITRRVHPNLITANPNRHFTEIVAALLPPGVNKKNLKEWEGRVDETIGEHSWVRKITVASERPVAVKRTESMLDFGTDDDWYERTMKRIRTIPAA